MVREHHVAGLRNSITRKGLLGSCKASALQSTLYSPFSLFVRNLNKHEKATANGEGQREGGT